MARVKDIKAYMENLEISYGVYVVKINFDFKRLKFRAYTETGFNLPSFDVANKKKHLTVIDECLDKIGLKHVKEILNIKEHKTNYETLFKYEADEKPVCYIEPDDLFKWFTVQKMKNNDIYSKSLQ